MPVVSPKPARGRISLCEYLCVYLRFQWQRRWMQLHRARIALHSRGLSALLRRSVQALPAQPSGRNTAVAPAPAQSGGGGGKRLLVIDTEPPRPDRDSGSVRCQHLLQLLVSLGYQVTLHCEGRAATHEEADELRTLGVTLAPSHGPNPRWLAEPEQHFSAAIVCRYHLALAWLPLLRRLQPGCQLILDTVDLHHLREASEAQLRDNRCLAEVAAATRRHELRAIGLADIVWVVSAAERDYLHDHAVNSTVAVIPNLHAEIDEVAAYADREGFLFVGGGRHPPNLDAVQWLLEEIFPQIRAALPEAQLHLVGGGLREALHLDLSAHPGVTLHGQVAQLPPMLSACRVSLAPLRFGAGVKGKVSEAMSHGLPVVTTSIGAEGMHLVPDQHALIAEDAETLAAAAVRAHQDPLLWQQLSEQGRELARQRFSLHQARQILAELLP